MNFKVGSYVEWKHVKGYIRFISDEYITICVNIHDDTILTVAYAVTVIIGMK
ncbi:MAG: hypothetical protein RLZZ148_183 [Cyanobacteriota bacterium]